MNILFVRHAKAVDRPEFKGHNDMERPLTVKGLADAKKAFKKLVKAYKTPEIILTSCALRARDTAEVLAAAFNGVDIKEIEALNPGCTAGRFKKIIRQISQEHERIAVVGHDPDFTEIIGDLVSDGSLCLEVKKGSCIEVEWDLETDRGILTLLIPPGFLRAL